MMDDDSALCIELLWSEIPLQKETVVLERLRDQGLYGVWEHALRMGVLIHADTPDHRGCPVEGCPVTEPHHHRDTLDGDEVVRLNRSRVRKAHISWANQPDGPTHEAMSRGDDGAIVTVCGLMIDTPFQSAEQRWSLYEMPPTCSSCLDIRGAWDGEGGSEDNGSPSERNDQQ